MPRAVPGRTCPSVRHRLSHSQDQELQLPGKRLQEQPSAGAFGPHLFFSWFSVQVLPGEEYFCPPFPWHGAQRRNTQRCTQLLSAWHFMGHTFGQTAWRQSTSIKLKWSLCKRARNSFQLPFQSCIDRLTSVLPSNTPSLHLPHLSYAQNHRWHFLTSLFAQDFPFKARSVGPYAQDSWSMAAATLSQICLFHSSFQAVEMTAALNPLALLPTWIQFVVVEKAQCILQLQGALSVQQMLLRDAESRAVPAFTSASQVRIPA